MSVYSFVVFDGQRYRYRQSGGPLGYAVVVWHRIGWRLVNKETAKKVLTHAGVIA